MIINQANAGGGNGAEPVPDDLPDEVMVVPCSRFGRWLGAVNERHADNHQAENGQDHQPIDARLAFVQVRFKHAKAEFPRADLWSCSSRRILAWSAVIR